LINDRIPPHSIDAEMSVLGCILIDNSSINFLSLTGNQFYKSAHRIIFDKMREMINDALPADVTTLGEALKPKGKLKEVGGIYYLTELNEIVPSAALIKEYEKIIINRFKARQLIEIASILQRDAHELEDPEQLIDDTCDALIRLSISEQSDSHISSAIHAFMDDVDKRARGEIQLIDAPLIGGCEPGEVTIIGAAPSVGKTSLVTQTAYETNVPVGYISLESNDKVVAGRMLSQISGVDFTAIRTGKMREAELELVIAASAKLSNTKIYTEFYGGKIHEILARSHGWISKHGIKLLVIDYLQLIQGGTSESKNIEVGNISRAIARHAVRTGLHILLLSQLSRDGRSGGRPQMHHLRDSGSIEQDADRIILLSRPNPADKSRVICDTVKARNGATCETVLSFTPETMMFGEGI